MDLNDLFLRLALNGSEWVLWLLVAISVATAAVTVERWLAYRGVSRLEAQMAELVTGGGSYRWTQIREMAGRLDAPGARLIGRVMRARRERADNLDLILESAKTAEKVRLEHNLAFLGTVGANAPFIGLLGTVLEILRVFNLLGEQGVASAADASSIMTGISEALVATGVGLIVAIPATVAYNAFLKRVGALLSRAEETASVGLEYAGVGEGGSV
ncbi:MAG: MotA/TolQ/ExbB proton channel family protein [Nannocystaceae bacterium]|nr:MotA/TolQ/ExbB proton channel family protein [Nannocystaceae bacterium]